jgi:hypothetical protein
MPAMTRRKITIAAAATMFAGAGFLFASVPAIPTTQPAGANVRPLADLQNEAFRAFENGDYANALPLLKDLSVRLRNTPDQVAPVLEKVRVCEASLAKQPIEGVTAPRVAHVKPAQGEVLELALQKLGNFTYDAEKGGGIPEDVTALTGSTVKLHGFMIPIDQSERVTKFVLVADLFSCCFGQPPQLQHTAVVICPEGKAVQYYPEEINVTGELTVAEVRDEGYVTHIFELKASSIRPVPK